MTDWLSAEEALTRLRVRPQTLYAYVSRGRVRAEPDPVEPRRSRYRASDVAALAERKARGRKAADVAAAAIAWGEPVLASAITTVRDGRLYYRGHDAVRLSETATLEEVARLLRGGDRPAAGRAARPRRRAPTAQRAAFAAFAARADADPPAQGRAADDLAGEAARLLDLMAAAVAGPEGHVQREEEAGAIHERLGRGLAGAARRLGRDPPRAGAAGRPRAQRLDLRRAGRRLDRRLAGGRGAGRPLARCPARGTAAWPRGSRPSPTRPRGRGWRKALRAGEPPPGFGHALYPDGDPRAAALLGAFEVPPALAALRAEVEAATGERANVDFALVALRQSLGLPAEAPFALFAARPHRRLAGPRHRADRPPAR